jgi:hypothetical protein
MATDKTFMGAPKPLGASGHFDEPTRHALQAQGFKTGNLSSSSAPAVYEQWGISNLEKKAREPEPVPRTAEGLVDVEAIAESEKQPPKKSLSQKVKEKLGEYETEFKASREREQAKRKMLKKKSIYEGLGKDLPADEAQMPADVEDEDLPAKFGTFLADLSSDYDSEDMVGLTNAELETLAIRFHAQNKDGGFLGEPENPFLAELKSRLAAEAEMRREKAQILAEIKNPAKKEKGLLSELFFDDEPEPKAKKGKQERGFFEELFTDEPERKGKQEKGMLADFF